MLIPSSVPDRTPTSRALYSPTNGDLRKFGILFQDIHVGQHQVFTFRLNAHG